MHPVGTAWLKNFDLTISKMGLALSQLEECPAGTRLLLALYGSCCGAPWLLNQVGIDTRGATLNLFTCCLANVFTRQRMAPLLLSVLHRPLCGGSDALLAVTEVQTSVSCLPAVEQELGSFRFLIWLATTTGGSNMFFLLLMSFLQKQGGWAFLKHHASHLCVRYSPMLCIT